MVVAPEALELAVLGPGAVGGLLAALLARAGNSVVVLAGESTARAIAERGLRVESRRFGDFEVNVASALQLQCRVDACLITVKATQLEQALKRVAANDLGQALVVPLLNGIDHVDLLRSVYPAAQVVAATMRIEAKRVGPGVIQHLSPFASVEIATSAAGRDGVERLAAKFTEAGLDVSLRENETAMLWDKLVFLAPLALLTTHERANAGAIRTRRRDDALALISEAAAVANAEGAAVDSEAVVRLLDSVPPTMESSMQRDLAAGLPLELDAIVGAVIRRAARAKVAVPVTTRLLDELTAGAPYFLDAKGPRA
jgi:2-dehydropantoate 2-reductase